MMTSIVETHSDELRESPTSQSAEDKEEKSIVQDIGSGGVEGICAICLENIELKETALIKGCEHAYCVTCILRWAYVDCKKARCPQCKNPFDFLNIHRTLDGSIRDYMFEESVCLLLRAAWFEPLSVEGREDNVDDVGWYELEDEYEDEEDDLDEVYASRGGNLRIGNRRWGDNGYVRAGRQEARPVLSQGSTSATRNNHNTGRRAKRTMKREAANRAALR